MDLRLTNNELEIKHANKEDVIEVINAIEKIICSKLNMSLENLLNVTDAPVEPVRKLVFVKCPYCGHTFFNMTPMEDEYAEPTMHCKCGETFEAHELTKGEYTCDCGQKGFFLMTPDVDRVSCKRCKKDIYMVYNEEEKIYTGYID